MHKTITKLWVNELNLTLVNFFKASKTRYEVVALLHYKVKMHMGCFIWDEDVYMGCFICKVEDHGTKSYPKYGNAQSKCRMCSTNHKLEKCGIKCTHYHVYGHIQDHSTTKCIGKRFYFSSTNYLDGKFG